LIIVDEEHEGSYKQNDGLRYNGRDIAVKRAQLHSCPVVLGSATPSFESLLNASQGRFNYLQMPNRATERPLPEIEVVNMLDFRKADLPSESISPPLFSHIQRALEKKQQIIILYNRRGFSSYLQCTTCNEVVGCPQCSVPLTYHKGKNKCMCHYCGITMEPPELCSYCRDPRTTSLENEGKKEPRVGKLAHRGGGTERVVSELETLFPDARLARMDRDTVTHKGAYREILGKMRTGEADILVGTQMIAKGHDLPGVTLVGVIDADVGLHLPDFRASERTYQLITQAAGRAGRGREAGRVIVQTREPNHPTLVAAITGRFRAFARYELQFRKRLSYPPYGRLLRLVISSPDPATAQSLAYSVGHWTKELGERISELHASDSGFAVVGPAPAPHEKLRGRFRWHILVKSNSARALSQTARALRDWQKQNPQNQDVRLTIDIDPVDML
jgi:primosomal protein N' (replication factor Y)